MYVRFITLALLVISSHISFAEKIDKEFFRKHLATDLYAIDSEASAVVLYESNYVNISDVARRQTLIAEEIIKILKPDALDAANIKIDYYDYLTEDYVSKITAVTYNLVGNEVIETKINPNDIYFKKISKGHYELSFSLPAVKEGSIIRYSYQEISRSYDDMPKWPVQGEYPKLVSEYNLVYPQRMEITAMTHVNAENKEYPTEEEARNGAEGLCHSSRLMFNNERHSISSFWIRKNVAGVLPEPYITTIANVMEHVEFHVTGYVNQFGTHQVTDTWDKLNDMLLKGTRFGEDMTAANGFLRKTVDSITGVDTSLYGIMNNMFSYVRDNFKNDPEFDRYLYHHLYEVFAARTGTGTELNLILTAMLRRAHVAASPVILSTVGHRSPSPVFPLVDRFNYVACAVKYESGYVLLDASDKNNYFAALPQYCYNGYARILKTPGEGIDLTGDALNDKSIVAVNIGQITKDGANVEIIRKQGMVRSSAIRKTWAAEEKDGKELLDEIVRNLPASVNISERNIYNDKNPDTNLVIKLKGRVTFEDGADELFITSVIIKNFTKNPFTAVKRIYPIEFPFKHHYQYVMNISLPADMLPLNLHEPTELSVAEDGIVYRKRYTYNPDLHILSVTCLYAENKAAFPVEQYNDIREFYRKMINEDNDVITLKRTSAK